MNDFPDSGYSIVLGKASHIERLCQYGRGGFETRPYRRNIDAKRTLTGARMVFNPDRHHRRSIRLKDYNYSQEGAYFVTICTHERECCSGKSETGKCF